MPETHVIDSLSTPLDFGRGIYGALFDHQSMVESLEPRRRLSAQASDYARRESRFHDPRGRLFLFRTTRDEIIADATAEFRRLVDSGHSMNEAAAIVNRTHGINARPGIYAPVDITVSNDLVARSMMERIQTVIRDRASQNMSAADFCRFIDRHFADVHANLDVWDDRIMITFEVVETDGQRTTHSFGHTRAFSDRERIRRDERESAATPGRWPARWSLPVERHVPTALSGHPTTIVADDLGDDDNDDTNDDEEDEDETPTGDSGDEEDDIPNGEDEIDLMSAGTGMASLPEGAGETTRLSDTEAGARALMDHLNELIPLLAEVVGDISPDHMLHAELVCSLDESRALITRVRPAAPVAQKSKLNPWGGAIRSVSVDA